MMKNEQVPLRLLFIAKKINAAQVLSVLMYHPDGFSDVRLGQGHGPWVSDVGGF